MSYIVGYRSTDLNRPCLGGKFGNSSAPFECKEDAEAFLEAAIHIHLQLNPPLIVVGAVVESDQRPTIKRKR